jgi:hypothetical protein
MWEVIQQVQVSLDLGNCFLELQSTISLSADGTAKNFDPVEFERKCDVFIDSEVCAAISVLDYPLPLGKGVSGERKPGRDVEG